MTKVNVAHKNELDPNLEQKIYFKKACGINRFTYNWACCRWQEKYEANKLLDKKDRVKISGFSLKKEFNSIKEKEFPFMYEVTKWANQQPFSDLDVAYQRFFKGTSGKPKFKKKNKSKDSFYIAGADVKIEGRYLKIPNLKSKIKMKESLRFHGKINSVTISRTADKWFVSVQVEMLKPTVHRKYNDGHHRVVGVDLGVKTMVMTSDGVAIENPRFLKKRMAKLKTAQRKLARQIKAAKKDKRELRDSKNFIKQKQKIARLHYQVVCKRKDAIHKITNYLTKNYNEIVIESLNVKGMVKNHNLAQALSDVSFGEFRRQLTYKSEREGCLLTVADRFYPSSKTCSCCGFKKENLTLKDRVFSCESCHAKIDRDLNAAINLEKLSQMKKGKVLSFTSVEKSINLRSLKTLKTDFCEADRKQANHTSL